jgi:hypothetical protein
VNKNQKRSLRELKRREALHYPVFMRQMQYLYSWKDLKEYCEGSPTVLLGNKDGYALFTKKEIVDVASSSAAEAAVLFLSLRKHFTGNQQRRITADFRNSTSLPIVLAAAKKGVVKIHTQQDWYWEGELMTEIEFSFIARRQRGRSS